jgi:hypothetical protein
VPASVKQRQTINAPISAIRSLRFIPNFLLAEQLNQNEKPIFAPLAENRFLVSGAIIAHLREKNRRTHNGCAGAIRFDHAFRKKHHDASISSFVLHRFVRIEHNQQFVVVVHELLWTRITLDAADLIEPVTKGARGQTQSKRSARTGGIAFQNLHRFLTVGQIANTPYDQCSCGFGASP